MTAAKPLVLVANASRYEWDRLVPTLNAGRWKLQRVEKADEADRACRDERDAPVLVIDAGLLGMARDPQWRELRDRRPDLGVIVRCLLPEAKHRRVDERTFFVDPDDGEEICRAIRVLSYRGTVAPS